MRKSKKQLLRTLMACGLVISVAAGGTVAYLTDAETATNTFTVGKVKIDLEEPGYPGNDSDEVKNIIPNQEIVKDPQIENTGNNDALVFLRVEVPQEEFTELDADNNVGEKKLQDLFKLKNVSDQWELLRTETTTDADGKVKTSYVYGYKKTLAKGSTTDKLFQKVQMKNSIEKDLEGNVEDVIVTACAIQATDIPDVDLTPGSDGGIGKDVLDQVYTIFLNQSGDQTPRQDEDNKTQEESSATLFISQAINAKFKTLARDSSVSYDSEDTAIMAIQRTNERPSDAVIADATSLISAPNSLTPIYAWFDNGTIKWWSEAKKVYAESLDYLCSGMKNLSDISGLAEWDTGNVTSMESTFYKCSQITDLTPLENWDTGKAISMHRMFYGCAGLTNLNGLANWDTSNVVTLGDIFWDCTCLTDLNGLANWNTGNVTDMGSMFYDCVNLTNLKALADWNTGKASSINGMFLGCTSLTKLSGLENWDVGNVSDMNNTFYGCTNLSDTSAINNWNISNVGTRDFGAMFQNCPSHPEFTKRDGSWSNGTFIPTT